MMTMEQRILNSLFRGDADTRIEQSISDCFNGEPDESAMKVCAAFFAADVVCGGLQSAVRQMESFSQMVRASKLFFSNHDGGIVVLSAPSGYGKSTAAMRAWLQSTPSTSERLAVYGEEWLCSKSRCQKVRDVQFLMIEKFSEKCPMEGAEPMPESLEEMLYLRAKLKKHTILLTDKTVNFNNAICNPVVRLRSRLCELLQSQVFSPYIRFGSETPEKLVGIREALKMLRSDFNDYRSRTEKAPARADVTEIPEFRRFMEKLGAKI